MAQLLRDVAVGTVLKLKENGSPQNYIVVHQGKPSSIYDESCNGTWLLRQDLIEEMVWDNGNVNKLESSDIQAWLNSTMLGKYDSNIQAAIKQVKIPYRKNGGSGGTDQTGANGLSCKVFLLSGYEVGWTTSTNSYFPVDGSKLSYFIAGTGSSANNKRIAKLNGSATGWWLRSPRTGGPGGVFLVDSYGDWRSFSANGSGGVRPALVLPTDLLADDSNNIIIIPTVSTLTAPSLAMQQQSIPLSWTPVSVSGFDVTYQLQRNVDSGGWTTIYTGSNTSYTDTAGAWNQVQYQVAAVIENVIGNYTQSSIIPVSNPSALVISGSDGNLGTLTSNLPYTVSSNTGNPISLTRTVNGAQVVTLTVESGFAYNIPIADLPTGTGTIQITASVESGSETVTQTRTWTYYKTPINIPSTGGIAQLTQNGQNIWPVTVPDAVEAPAYLGGNLNAALNKLGQAALYTKSGSITDVFGYDVPICQYEIGSYVGTGTYGSINQSSSLTFSFEPKIVVIFRVKGDNSAPNYNTSDPKNSPLFMINGVNGITQSVYNSAYWGNNESQWEGNIVKWYSGNVDMQKNLSGSTYNYVAIG